MDAAAVVALAGALQGAALAAALWRRGARLAANRWLALLMALVSLRLVNQFAYRSPLFGSVPPSPRFTVPLLFTFAPLLFLYLRTLVRPTGAARAIGVVHFLPALAVLAYCAPFYWTAARGPAGAWASYGQALRWESTVLNGVIALQTGWYLARIWRLLPAYDRRAREVASNLDAARFRWTRWLAWALLAEVVILVLVITLQLLGIGGAVVARRDLLFVGLMAVTIYGAGYMALSQPALFVEEPDGEPGRKYGKSSLTAAPGRRGRTPHPVADGGRAALRGGGPVPGRALHEGRDAGGAGVADHQRADGLELLRHGQHLPCRGRPAEGGRHLRPPRRPSPPRHDRLSAAGRDGGPWCSRSR